MKAQTDSVDSAMAMREWTHSVESRLEDLNRELHPGDYHDGEGPVALSLAARIEALERAYVTETPKPAVCPNATGWCIAIDANHRITVVTLYADNTTHRQLLDEGVSSFRFDADGKVST